MASMLTPGVYFQPLIRQRAVTALVRSDIAAFLGYARQGPVGLPVQVHSWRQFLTVFSEPYEVGYLADVVKGFFENGGAACYISRITDDSATSAVLTLSTALGYEWKFSASFLLSTIATQLSGEKAPEAAIQLASEQAVRQLVKRAPNPGQWGNQLSLSLAHDASSNTWTVPGIIEQGFVTQVERISGLGADSIVELYQEGKVGLVPVVRVERVDALRKQVFWTQSLHNLAFDLERPIRLESIEFSLQVALDNRVVETFSRLSVHPDHERYIKRVLEKESRYIVLEVTRPSGADKSHYTNSGYWPPCIFNLSLSGGTDGLTGIQVDHYLKMLATLEKVDDVGLLAAPDLVLKPEIPTPVQVVSTVTTNCQVLEELPKGALYGRVVSIAEGIESGGEEDIEVQALAGVTVTYAAGAKQTMTNTNGEFQLDNIETGLITLHFEKSGYGVEEQLTFIQTTSSTQAVNFYLTPLLFPPALSDNDILQVQQRMAKQGESGLYRFALLDPPEPDMKIDEIRSWRQQLGNTAYAALHYPWLGVPQQAGKAGIGGGELKWVPPSGHIAGIIAKTDLTEGVHRAPANFVLHNVKQVAVEINDAQQSVLNPEGINCIRSFAGRGLRPYGARTLSADTEWRYLNVRRLVSALEKTLEKTMQWAVFESNNTLLRQAITYNINALLNRLWHQGALAGNQPEAAYVVKCDEDNNPPNVRDAGLLITEVAVAPAVPFEFIIFRLGKTLDAFEVTE